MALGRVDELAMGAASPPVLGGSSPKAVDDTPNIKARSLLKLCERLLGLW